MNKRIVWGAFLIAIGAPTIAYWIQFSYEFQISNSQEVWAHLGDFLGGTVGPALTFISTYLLINSLNHQVKSNNLLDEQIITNQTNEKLRTFETSFFHLVACQSSVFQNMKVEIIENNITKILYANEAVKEIEKILELYELQNKSLTDVQALYKQLNKKYNLHDVLRSFHVLVSLIDNMLSEERGFSEVERKEYYLRLINVTSFSNLILICIISQFSISAIAESLKNHPELNVVMDEVSLPFKLYKKW